MLRDGSGRMQVDRWVDNLVPMVEEAKAALRQMNPADIAWRSGARLEKDRLHLEMVFQPYEIDVETFAIQQADGKEPFSFFQALILVYLQTADGAPSADRWISFRELPHGTFYHQAFQGYAPNRLTKRWGNDLEGFVVACCALDGDPLEFGDACFAFKVMPRIPVTVVYWLGDEDFPSRASVLFDANAHHYMVTDGLAILGNQLVGKILKAK